MEVYTLRTFRCFRRLKAPYEAFRYGFETHFRSGNDHIRNTSYERIAYELDHYCSSVLCNGNFCFTGTWRRNDTYYISYPFRRRSSASGSGSESGVLYSYSRSFALFSYKTQNGRMEKKSSPLLFQERLLL